MFLILFFYIYFFFYLHTSRPIYFILLNSLIIPQKLTYSTPIIFSIILYLLHMPKKQQKSKKLPEQTNKSPITSNLLLQNQSQINNPSQVPSQSSEKPTYVQYINTFLQEHQPIDYEKSTHSEIEKSLNEMRILLKEFNTMINKMMDKNYELLAEYTPGALMQPYNLEKDVEILTAEIENSKKLVAIQQSQISNLIAIGESIKDRQEYEQRLIDDISEIKQKMPSVTLQSKHEISDISKNGYTLMNQEQDQSLYLRVNHLKNDYERAYERYRKMEAKAKQLDEKLSEFEQKQYEMSEKLNEAIEKAKNMAIQVTARGTLISLKAKHEQLQKKRDQERKKIALFEHVSKANQQNIQKSMGDMRKLMAEYEAKIEFYNLKIRKVEDSNDDILNKSNVIEELTKKSLPFKFAETLLKSEQSVLKKNNTENDRSKKDNSLNVNRSRLQHNLQDIDNKQKDNSRIKNKPYFSGRRKQLSKSHDFNEEKPTRNYSKPELVGEKKRKKEQFLENQEGVEKQKSQIFSYRIRSNSKPKIEQESPKAKLWKQDKEQPEKQKIQYKISKPTFSLKRKSNLLAKNDEIAKNDTKQYSPIRKSEENIVAPKFSRLANNKRKITKEMNDQYTRYLENKGRKILGLDDE